MRLAFALFVGANLAQSVPLCSEFKTAFNQMRFVPYVADGQLQGYVVHGVTPNSVLSKFGFHERDLLTEIDGVRLTDEKAMRSALGGLCSTKRAPRVELLRSGKLLALEIVLNQTPR